MPVPDFQTVMLPLLRLTGDGAERTVASAIESLAKEFALTDAERQELLPGGSQRRFNNRVYWAATHLRAAGLISSPTRGRLLITDRGRHVLSQNLPKIDIKYLAQFPGYQEFKTGGTGTPPGASPASAPAPAEAQTPDEVIAAAYQQVMDQLAHDLLDRVRSAPPDFFERLVIQLLQAMGYGGPLPGAAIVVGGPGDSGIDGIIREDRLGLDLIYVQAKRWAGPVGRKEIQSFVGSLEGKHATRGVFLTTSTFTGEARSFVENIAKRIVLIDGAELARLMVEHNVGVAKDREYVIKRIDSNFFEVS